ncbi:retrovirus-related pol polyprotein from transposon TNT 1-94 [Tanacetum coccineum]
MALGYQNPFYLKQVQQKQQSIISAKCILEKQDSPVVHDSEETLCNLPQETQVTKEVCSVNTPNWRTVQNPISYPNEEFLDELLPSVFCSKDFLNEDRVRFGNDHVAAILGFSDLQWGNILITRVYFVEGLGHNLFSVGQFCDSDLENDHEDIEKLGAKGDIGFFIGYSADSCAYRVYNRRTKKIMETMNVTFDELSAMAFEQSSEIGFTVRTMYDDYIGGHQSSAPRTAPAAQAPQVLQTPTTTTTTADTAPTPTNSSSQATNFPITSQDVDEFETQQHTKEHPLEQVLEKPLDHFDKNQLRSDVTCSFFIDADQPSHVYKLKKALYGLKQAPRAWYDELSTFLLQNHFFKGTIDPTLFIRRFDDDILVLTNPRGIFINQSNYVLEILKKYGMETCDPVGTPMEIKDKLDLDQNGSSRCNKKWHEHVEMGTIELYFVKTDYQLADLFTKALPVDRFNYLVRRLGMRSLSPKELERLAKSR